MNNLPGLVQYPPRLRYSSCFTPSRSSSLVSPLDSWKRVLLYSRTTNIGNTKQKRNPHRTYDASRFYLVWESTSHSPKRSIWSSLRQLSETSSPLRVRKTKLTSTTARWPGRWSESWSMDGFGFALLSWTHCRWSRSFLKIERLLWLSYLFHPSLDISLGKSSQKTSSAGRTASMTQWQGRRLLLFLSPEKSELNSKNENQTPPPQFHRSDQELSYRQKGGRETESTDFSLFFSYENHPDSNVI